MCSRKERVLGALLGVHSGDSLGAALEFRSWASIRKEYPQGLRDIIGGGKFNWKVGQATDDTDLTRAVLLAYYDAAQDKTDTADVIQLAGQYMLDWLDGKWPDRQLGSRPHDIGESTELGLQRWRRTNGILGGAGPGKAGNGSLMRCIPTGLFVHDRSIRLQHSSSISAITHDEIRCTVSCAAYNEIVAALLDDKSPVEAVEIGLKSAEELDETYDREVINAIKIGQQLHPSQLAENGPHGLPIKEGSGHVLDSLSLAVAAVLDPRPLIEVMVDICRVGRDTDTNTAIVGGLLGARDGVGALPERWLEKLQFREEFERLARALLESSPSL